MIVRYKHLKNLMQHDKNVDVTGATTLALVLRTGEIKTVNKVRNFM